MTDCYRGKVLQIINSLSMGGAEKLLVDFVLTAKNKYRWNMDILTLFDANSFRVELNKANIKVRNLGLPHKYALWCLPKLIKEIKKGGYSCIHVHLFPANFYVATASLFLREKIAIIFTEHSIWNRRRSFRVFKILDRFIYSRFRKIVCVSEIVRRELIKWLPLLSKKTIVISNGVALPKMNMKAEKKFDLIFVGRLIKAKGIDILLDAISKLKEDGIIIKIAIVGDGPLRFLLQEKVVNLGIENMTVFLGARKDVPNLMQQSKFFVLPSRWEGLPLTILEAMGLGIPIIATQVGGVIDVIRNGKEGILLPKENPVALKNAVLSLLTDNELANELATNAKRKFDAMYSIERYVDKMNDLYATIEK